MANVINLNITPLRPIQTDVVALASTEAAAGPSSSLSRPPLSQPPKKRLRSCLSPSRSRPSTPFEDRDDYSGCTSRSVSFGSERSKSVRWEGEVPVTSYFDTYSRDEYDRTPLEAPSAEERACVLPARNSRCMTRSYQCFLSDANDEIDEHVVSSPSPINESPLSSPALAALDAALTSIVEVPCESLDSDDELYPEDDLDRIEEEDDDDEGDADEDRQWEECMERRRMMFARMCGQEESDRHPQFDGYRSLSSTLANLLKSVGCDEPTEPVHGPVEASVSAENLELRVGHERPLDTPSLTSGSSDDSEAETLVNSLAAVVDTINPSAKSAVVKPDDIFQPIQSPVAFAALQ